MSTTQSPALSATDLTVLPQGARHAMGARLMAWVNPLSALVTGLLVALSLPEHQAGWLAWFAMVPLTLASERAARVRDAWWLGWLSGTATNLIGLFWMVDLLQRFGPMAAHWAVLGYVGLCLYQGLVFGLFAVLTQTLRRHLSVRGRRLPLALVAPLVMVACELPLPFVFPWNLAMTQAFTLPVIQLAEVGGAFAVTALLMIVNGTLSDVCLGQGKARLYSLASGALLLAAALFWGEARIAELEVQASKAPKLSVGVVQGNVAASAQQPDMDTLRARLSALQDTSKELDARGAQLILWTETAYPYAMPGGMQRDYPSHYFTRVRRGFKAPLLFGAAAVDAPSSPGGAPRHTNSAFFLAADDRMTGRYDKNELVTFGEQAPLEDVHPLFKQLRLGSAGEYQPGKEVTSFALEQAGKRFSIAPMICLEDILSDMGRRVGALHPHLLVNLTNDAWFGPTSEPAQHMALAVFRSVEQRASMVRAVNTGPSAFISATGEVSGRTESALALDESRAPEGVLGEVALLEGGHTFFAQHGNAFAQLSTLLVLLGMLGARLQRTAYARAKQ